jgi:predicted acylesterase/phospholipase RssA
MQHFNWFDSGSDKFRRRNVDVVVTYEGGGARGIWHLGALRVIEGSKKDADEDYDLLPRYRVKGVNGTSMGALFASLHAVGYRPETILPRRGKSEVLRIAGVDNLLDLFNWQQRSVINLVRWLKSYQLMKWTAGICALAIIAVLIIVATFISKYIWPEGMEWHPVISISLYISATILLLAWAGSRIAKGLGDATEIANRLDLALAAVIDNYGEAEISNSLRDIASKKYNRRITFGHLNDYIKKYKDGKLPEAQKKFLEPVGLAIVASNITTGRLEKFSNSRTPSALIADAVAASCSIPFLFRPYAITRPVQANEPRVHLFVDGGITSNLPVWTSDMPRAANPDLISMSFGVYSSNEYTFDTFSNRIQALVNTTIFGSGPLETRRTRNAAFLYTPDRRLGRDLGLLDFHIDASRAQAEISAVERSLRLQMVRRAKYRAAHGRAARKLAVDLAALTPVGHNVRGGDAHIGRPCIRVTLLAPVNFSQDGLKKFQHYCSHPSRFFTDSEMTFDGTNSLPGQAWKDRSKERLLHFADLGGPGAFNSVGLMWRNVGGTKEKVDRRLDSTCWPAQWAICRRTEIIPPADEAGYDDNPLTPRVCVIMVESDINLADFGIPSAASFRDGSSVSDAIKTAFQEYEDAIRRIALPTLDEISEFVGDMEGI